MKISLCIPMYNESAVLPTTLPKVAAYMTAHFEDYEVLFSDDGSTDGSAELVRAFGDPHFRVVGYEKNRGKGCAVRTAMLASRGDLAIFTDCDLAYELEVVGRMVTLFGECPETDVIVGSRAAARNGYEGYSFLRRLASKTYVRLLAVIGGLRLSDSQTGLKGFRRAAADRIFGSCETDGFAFDFEVILFAQKYGFTIREMPVKVINQNGSKIHVARDAVRMLGDVRRIKKRVRHS